MAHCSKKPGNHHSGAWSAATRTDWETATVAELDAYSSNEEAKYCWCKATGYKSSSSAEIQGSVSPLAWVFDYDRGSAYNCAAGCALYCAYAALYYSAFRAALFLGSGDAD